MLDQNTSCQGAAEAVPPIRAAEPAARGERSLGWLAVMAYVLVRPWTFFGSRIHRLTVGGAVFAAVVNLLLALVLIVASPYVRFVLPPSMTSLQNSYHQFTLGDAHDVAISVAIAWAVVVACNVAGALLYASAMSGVDSFRQAFRRSLVLVGSLTSLLPVVAIGGGVMIVFIEALQEVARTLVGSSLAGVLLALLMWLMPAWVAAITWLALFRDGRCGPQVLRRAPADRCEKCGYLLAIIPEERQCPDCGWPVDDSLSSTRREPLPVECATRAQWPIRVLTTLCSGFLRPSRLWWRCRVRAGSVAPRNAFLVMTVAGTVIGTVLAFVLIVAAVAAQDFDDLDEALPVLVPICLGWGLAVFWVVLAGNHALLVVAIALARLRDNPLRLDELARVGYCSLGLPAFIQGVSALTLLGLFALFTMVGVRSYGGGPSNAQMIGQTVMVILLLGVGGMLIGALLGSLISTVRAMQAARHANY
ncbi:MAG: hypothetical protein JXL80_06465 [Planctomycetes bacterium]|nr:hypothetical protein [Planctomycetota bacterium]